MIINPEKEIHIFLDMDGVISDFEFHAKAQGKYEEDGETIKWDDLDYQWWITMPAVEGAREFYNALRKEARVKFLTGPVFSEDCFAGKAAWIKSFLPENGRNALRDLIICPSKNKFYLARENHILIDDRQVNIIDWNNYGGVGIHHQGDFNLTLNSLKAVIKDLKPRVRSR